MQQHAHSHLESLIDCCIGSKGSHYDVARVVHAVLHNDFRYDGKNAWYMRRTEQDHANTWILDEQRRELEVRIKIDVCRAITRRALYWQTYAVNPPNGDMSLKVDAQLRSIKLLDICVKVAKPRFLREVIKECRSFFVQED